MSLLKSNWFVTIHNTASLKEHGDQERQQQFSYKNPNYFENNYFLSAEKNKGLLSKSPL